MRQAKEFTAIKVPFVTGVELGVAITSPSSASEDVAAWLEEISAVVGRLDLLIVSEIVEAADARGLTAIKAAGERALTLTTTIRRELSISQGVLDALTPLLPDVRDDAEAPRPLRRAVELLRAQQKWRRNVDALAAAEAIDIDKAADGEAVINEAGRLFDVMLATPAPDVAAAAEKLKIIREGVGTADSTRLEAIERDLHALAANEAEG
jgi:uncharacterized protein (UPF0147 family)